MPLIDDARRWVKDRLSQDEHIAGTPKEKIREAGPALVNLSPAERRRTADHLRAYAEYYYQGRHSEHVPADVKQQLTAVDRQVARLDTVDDARAVLLRYGGPPSRQTLADSLERSLKERESHRQTVGPAAESEGIRQATGPRMHI